MTLYNQSLSDETATGEPSQTASETKQVAQSMAEYYQLQRMLLTNTLVLTGIVCPLVWLLYSKAIALNYLLGAVVGVLYLVMLGKEVENLGTSKKRIGVKGLVLVAGLIFLACTREELQIVPVFLGFMTYKATIIGHTIQMAVLSLSQKD